MWTWSETKAQVEGESFVLLPLCVLAFYYCGGTELAEVGKFEWD